MGNYNEPHLTVFSDGHWMYRRILESLLGLRDGAEQLDDAIAVLDDRLEHSAEVGIPALPA